MTWTAAPSGVLALVRLDGADTGLLHRLVDVEPSAIRSGMRVRAVLESQRQAQVTDLAGFSPVRS